MTSRLYVRFKLISLAQDDRTFVLVRETSKQKIRAYRRKVQQGLPDEARKNEVCVEQYERGLKQLKPRSPPVKMPDGSPLTSPSLMAEVFNA